MDNLVEGFSVFCTVLTISIAVSYSIYCLVTKKTKR